MVCEKIAYASHKLAQDAARGLGSKKGQGMRSYKCRECGGYHITTVKHRKNMSDKHVKYKHDTTKPLPKEIHIPNPSGKKQYSQKSQPLATYKPFAYFKNNQS